MVLEKHNTISASLVNATMSLNLIGEPNGQHQQNYIYVFPLRKLLKHRYQFKGCNKGSGLNFNIKRGLQVSPTIPQKMTSTTATPHIQLQCQ